jgi:hypothetical protein
MSTTTNFKRIALVAVAALGLGVLSSVPSQAVVNADTLTLSATTAAQTTAETSTATSATATLSFLGAANDSMSVTASLVSTTATGSTALPYLQLVETSNATVNGSGAYQTAVEPNVAAKVTSATAGIQTAKFRVYLGNDSLTAPAKVGTYVVKLTPAIVSSGSLNAAAQTITITVTQAAAKDTNASASLSTAFINQGETNAATATTETAVTADMTAGLADAGAVIKITQLNAAGVASAESLTVEVDAHAVLGASSTWASATDLTVSRQGKSLLVKKDDYVAVFSDGTSGKATITIKGSVTGALIATKYVTFYGDLATIKLTAVKSVIGARSSDAGPLTAIGYDAAGTLIPSTAMYVFPTTTTVISTGSCTAAAAKTTCTLNGVAAGTTDVVVGNKSTLAASTVKSNAVSIRVGGGSAELADVKVAFDKASYAPGEVATITVTPVDKAGLTLADDTYTVFATGGLVSDYAFGTNSVTITGTTAQDGAVAGTGTVSGVATYKVFMPIGSAGKVTVKYTTASGLATANASVARSVTATVNDSGAAALAAVTALATTVASLKTLIVTLTNLVLKIQKKVKA